MKDTLFLLYIDFSEGKDFFTLVGGLKSTVIQINKEAIRTEDYSQDWRLFVKNSGMISFTITAQGILAPELPKKLFDNLIEATIKGDELKIKVENVKHTFEGNFRVKLSFSDSFDSLTNFDINLESCGEVMKS